MVSRISDLRVEQAQRHGRIVGLPQNIAEEVAALSDFLTDCHIWSDVALLFEDQILAHGAGRWRVPVKAGWWLVFGWAEPFGPVELRLWHEHEN
jgi:hypothetical protein